MKRLLLPLIALLACAAHAADVKISNLPAGTTIGGTEAMPAVQSAATVKTTPAALWTYSLSQLTSANVISKWSGSCSVSNFLRGDGTCATVAPTPAALTKADDTNVTLTLGGAPSTALLNAASITAGWTGQLAVGRGGSGAATLTGPLKGNGAAAFSSAAAADIYGLWSGTCNSATFLRGDGACATPTVPAAANPTASVGLSAVNGSAGTFLRSDGAPVLDQSIAPTWTGSHTFANAIGFSSTNAAPRQLWNESDQTTDEKLWDWLLDAKTLTLRTRTDADGAGINVLSFLRGTGTALSSISLGNATNNPTFSFLGTGAISMAGGLTVTSTGGINAVRFSATGSTTPNNGFYLPATNTLGWATNSTQRLTINASGQVALQSVGAGLSIKEGSNAKMGTATLVAGTVVVSTTAVTATSRIFITSNADGGTPGYLRVSTRTAGTSFTITSGSALDTSTVAWVIIEPS